MPYFHEAFVFDAMSSMTIVNSFMKNQYEQHNPEMFARLSTLISSKQLRQVLARANRDLLQWINDQLEKYSSILSGCNIATKAYWILNDIHELPKCKCCNTSDNYAHKNIVSISQGYNTCCCKECGHKVGAISTSMSLKATFADKEKKDEIVKRRQKSCLERYGVRNPLQVAEIKQKVIDTNKQRYGGQPAANKSIQAKIRQTNIDRYGQAAFNYAKSEQTCIKKYGVTNVSQLESTKAKVRKSLSERYLADITSPMQAEAVKEKARQTVLEKYGVDNVSKRPEAKAYLGTGLKKKSYEEVICKNEFDEPMFSLDDYMNRKSDSKMLQFRCKKCGNIFFAKHYNGHHKRCEVCWPPLYRRTTSNEEKAFCDVVKAICKCTVLENTKQIVSPFELDVYVPEKKIAFEFDGDYWHSNVVKQDPLVHLNKTLKCEATGIELVHVLESQWRVRKQLVIHMLKQKFSSIDCVDGKLVVSKCAYDNISSFLSEFSTYNTTGDVCFKVCSDDIVATIVGHIDYNALNCRYVATKKISCEQLNSVLEQVCSICNINKIYLHEDRLWSMSSQLFIDAGMKIAAILPPKLCVFDNGVLKESTTADGIYDCGEDIFEFTK